MNIRSYYWMMCFLNQIKKEEKDYTDLINSLKEKIKQVESKAELPEPETTDVELTNEQVQVVEESTTEKATEEIKSIETALEEKKERDIKELEEIAYFIKETKIPFEEAKKNIIYLKKIL